jgi:hypothetical protein
MQNMIQRFIKIKRMEKYIILFNIFIFHLSLYFLCLNSKHWKHTYFKKEKNKMKKGIKMKEEEERYKENHINIFKTFKIT